MAFVTLCPASLFRRRASRCPPLSPLRAAPRAACVRAPWTLSAAPSPRPSAPSATSLETFLRDASALGTIRFVCVSAGAVLETIGRFDYPRSRFSTPAADYLTLAAPDRTFEAHVNLSRARVVTLSTEPAKLAPPHDIHVIRLRADDDTVLLSCLLMWDPSTGPGNYLHGAVDEFRRLRDKYGDRFRLDD